VDVVERVRTRLERVGRVERGPAGRPALLDELRQLVAEAEAWARAAAAPRAPAAAAKTREEVEGMR
jgi:hypothetical protein